MGSVEDMLKEKKLDIDSIKAPEELEARLRDALCGVKSSQEKTGGKHKIQKWWAAAIILLVLGGYSFDAVAYYGKKILGYDQVTEGNLSKLNELGKGQEINESVTFSNGVVVAVDGIFFDDNKLVVLYKAKGDIDKSDIGMPRLILKGIGTYHSKGGMGVMVEENTWAMKYDFESPAFFEKWMKVIISYAGKGSYEAREIKFKLDRNLAMNHVVKQEIYEKVEIDGIPLSFGLISVSPLEVNIKGSFGRKIESKQSLQHDTQLLFDLHINDKRITPLGGGMSSKNDADFEFENRFDGISDKIESMSIKNIRLVDREVVDKRIDIDYSTKNIKVDLGKVSMTIKEISFDGEHTYVKIQTPKNVEVPMGLLMGNNSLEFKGSELKNMGESDEWIHKFKGEGNGMQIGIKVVEYVKKSGVIVEIPVK